MHKFKKGDLVLGPKGCVGLFDEYANDNTLWCSIGDDCDTLAYWRSEDCQPAPDYTELLNFIVTQGGLPEESTWENINQFFKKYTKLVEAAERVSKAFDRTILRQHYLEALNSLKDARKALADIEAPQEPGYRWLTMDLDTPGYGEFWVDRPEYDGEDTWVNGGDYPVMPCDCAPSFLKPGQLWERRNGLPFGEETHTVYEAWNHQWWRLVEDHGERCETCVNMKLMSDKDNTCSWYACSNNYKPHPHHGMPGCKYQRKD